MDYKRGIVARRRYIPASEAYYAAPAVTYTGPGDVVPNATAWWGLRAYTAAGVGTTTIRLRRSSDNGESDFSTVAGGGLDIAGITSFKGAANLFVTKLYDQTGGGLDLVQTTAANQPGLTLSGLGSLPIIMFNGTVPQLIFNSSPPTIAQPYTLSSVATRTDTSGAFAIGSVNDGVGIFFHAANTIALLSATFLDAAGSDNVWHALQAIANGGSSSITIDSSTTSGTVSNVAISTNVTFGSGDNTGGFPLTGSMTEGGIWPVGFSAGQASSMNSNQHAYWGF